MLVGAGREFLATRASFKLDLRGPSLTIQTACSTSLVAVAQACQSLLLYQSDMALAGGASISFPQHRGYLHQEGGMVSADGTCRPFDADASGTIFGSGAGAVLLKRLEDALADGDHVYAVIRGSAVNNDGASKVGFTAPSLSPERAAEMEAAMKETWMVNQPLARDGTPRDVAEAALYFACDRSLQVSGQALGIDAVLLGGRACDPFSRRVLRVSMGAAFQMPIYRGENLADDLTALARDDTDFLELL